MHFRNKLANYYQREENTAQRSFSVRFTLRDSTTKLVHFWVNWENGAWSIWPMNHFNCSPSTWYNLSNILWANCNFSDSQRRETREQKKRPQYNRLSTFVRNVDHILVLFFPQRKVTKTLESLLLLLFVCQYWTCFHEHSTMCTFSVVSVLTLPIPANMCINT